MIRTEVLEFAGVEIAVLTRLGILQQRLGIAERLHDSLAVTEPRLMAYLYSKLVAQKGGVEDKQQQQNGKADDHAKTLVPEAHLSPAFEGNGLTQSKFYLNRVCFVR